MGSGTHSENNYHHHHHHQKNIHLQNGNTTASSSSSTNKTFFPILCRVSVKDTIISHHSTNIITCPKKDDPSSPRVSCMGQVKHHHHNQHHHHHLTPSSAIKHHHKIVSVKATNNIIYNQTLVDRRRTRKLSTKFSATTKNAHDSRCAAAVVPVLNLAELDPPLPVIKKLLQSGGGDTVNLWKRRSRGDGLTNLQIPTFQCTHSLQTHAVKFRPPSIA